MRNASEQPKKATLVCDACYDEQDIDRISKDLIGKRCRICNEVMFTREHWRSYQRIQVWVWIQKAFSWLFPWARLKTYKVRVGRSFSEIREK